MKYLYYYNETFIVYYEDVNGYTFYGKDVLPKNTPDSVYHSTGLFPSENFMKMFRLAEVKDITKHIGEIGTDSLMFKELCCCDNIKKSKDWGRLHLAKVL